MEKLNVPERMKAELHKTNKGIVWQCDLTNRIFVEFGGMTTAFKIHNFINFKRLVDGINIIDKLYDLSDEADFDIIEAPNTNHTFTLHLCDLIHLRELLSGAKFALYVNSFLIELLGDYEVV
ncbi:hypothetical protein [Emticicia sp. 21SJ11W-3]|uniref:hypothetical protein n=1 Tax=Emticicia sp. 21SJ11W-3 TaxID=2916755 RepID=UPI00209C919E|nr:hypothetical protein [Emticicia sp. 21SJ11W-3]UTA70318.1 hypothetical protein MB380_10940 [Emticicia sp. 21SJ11W-3]